MKRLLLGLCLCAATTLFAAEPDGNGERVPPGVRLADPSEIPASVAASADDFYSTLGDACVSLDMQRVSVAPAFVKNKLIGYAISTGRRPILEGTPLRNWDTIIEVDGRPAVDRLETVCNVLSGKEKLPVTVLRDHKRLVLSLR